MISTRQFCAMGCGARVLLAGLVLALVLQGAHVCLPSPSDGTGVQASISGSSPICLLCAVVHTMLLPLLLILFSLALRHSRTQLLLQPVRPFLRGLRLDLRAPPVL